MPFPSVGGARLIHRQKIIRFALHGHSNRPFFHIVLTNNTGDRQKYTAFEANKSYDITYEFMTDSDPLALQLAPMESELAPELIIAPKFKDRDDQPIEQLGTFDPMPNTANQKLLSLNIERTRYWMGQGAVFSQPVSELLGLVGFLPFHPRVLLEAWRNREKIAADEKQAAEEAAANPNVNDPTGISSPAPSSSSA